MNTAEPVRKSREQKKFDNEVTAEVYREINRQLPYGNNTDALSIERESVFDVDGFKLSSTDIQALPEFQMPLLRNTKDPLAVEEADRIAELAKKACANCPGHCCLALTINSSIAEMEEQLERTKTRLNEKTAGMLWEGFDETTVAGDLRGVVELAQSVYDLKFAITNFKPMKGKTPYTRVYSCQQFDPVAWRCMSYDTRPTMCRRYICGPATTGNVPDGANMESKNWAKLVKIIKKHAKTGN